MVGARDPVLQPQKCSDGDYNPLGHRRNADTDPWKGRHVVAVGPVATNLGVENLAEHLVGEAACNRPDRGGPISLYGPAWMTRNQ